MRSPARRPDAFTLYEVLIAAALLGLVVVTTLSMFPKAIETQKIARQKIYAATIAQELVTNHSEGSLGNFKGCIDDYPLARSINGPDLERNCFVGASSSIFTSNTLAGGASDETGYEQRLFEPVPPSIVRRLDSDDNEIAKLAEMGASLFYMRYRAVKNLDGTLESSQEAVDTLIFGVVGYPQENAAFHAQSNWRGANQDSYRRRTPTIGGATRRRNNFYWAGDGGSATSASANTPLVWPAKSYFWEHEALVLDSYLAQPTTAINNFAQWPYGPYPDGATLDVDTGLPVRREETNSLYMPFKPWERCRQLVFWSVDWKSYEDFETVKPLASDVSRMTTVSNAIEADWVTAKAFESDLGMPMYPAIPTSWDRNFNQRVDTGRVPAPVRLRAKTVTRFNYYDKRLVMTY